MGTGNSASPIDLVRKLSSDEFGSLHDDIAAGRAETSLKALDERGAASELIQDQYTGRYPLELLQNANDAVASDGATGKRVKFILTQTALLVADQGAGFGVEQVRAICGLARSSKDPRKSVGYKGLGFKSVGEITDAPQVISGSTRFGFDASRVRRDIEQMLGRTLEPDQRLPDYAFPFEVDQADLAPDVAEVEGLLADGFRTVMRLPFRHPDDRKAVERHTIDALIPRLLIFLDATESLELAGTTQDFEVEAARDDRDGYQEVLLVCGDRTEHFLVFRHEAQIDDRSLVEDIGRAWSEVDAVRIAVAVPLGADRQPIGGASEPIHVYFPTEEETGVSLIFNADFQVELDRRRIAGTASAQRYNDWLLGKLSTYISDEVIPRLTREFESVSVLNVLAAHGRESGWGERLMAQVFSSLADQACIPCRDLQLRKPSRARLLSRSVPDPNALYDWLEGLPELVHRSVEQSKPVRRLLVDRLGVDEVSDRELLLKLEPSQNEDVDGFYRMLLTWSNSAPTRLFVQALSEARCIRLPDGVWARPSDGAVFLPSQRGESDFPPDLQLPIAQLPAIDGLQKLLADAGAEPLEWRPLITKFLMPRLSDPLHSGSERRSALAALRIYYDRIRRRDAGAQDIREAVRATLLPARNTTRTATRLRRAEDLYFGADWLPGATLETLYGPFDECDFLAEKASPDADEVAFYSWLGVSDCPKVVQTSLRDADYLTWRNSEGFTQASHCVSGHPNSQRLDSTPTIDRLPQILQSDDWDKHCALWTCLSGSWNTYRESLRDAAWRCTASARHPVAVDRVRRFISPGMFLLRERAWVPATRSGRRSLTTPNRIWHGSIPSEVARELYAPSPEVVGPPRDFASDLGMINIGLASAADLIKPLTDFETELQSADPIPIGIVSCAQWLLRSLNDARDLRQVEPESVPLISRVREEYRFARDPYVVHNRRYEDVWGDTVAIYAGDRNLTHLLRTLALRVLDDCVRIEAVCGARQPELELTAASRLREAAPALIALVREEVPSQMSELARMLQNISVVCSPHLSLEQTLEDFGTRSDESATAYIDSTGIAYIQSDGTEIDWPSVALRLAEHVQVDLGDAFALVLGASDTSRANFLRARHIAEEDLDAAAAAFAAEYVSPLPPDAIQAVPEGHTADGAQSSQDVGFSATSSMQSGTSSGDVAPADNGQTVPWSAPTASREQPFAVSETSPNPVGDGEGRRQTTSPSATGNPDRIAETSPVGSTYTHATRQDRNPANTADADQSHSRFYSYVVPHGSREARMAERAEAEAMRIGEAGVDHVLAYERRSGRVPVPQNHSNKGFDVLSTRPDGSDRRVIEIKASTTAWPARGVPVSRHQFEKNIEEDDDFWLYVVEFATDPQRARVIPIRNPASAVDYFVFDPGWEHLVDRQPNPS